MYMSLDKILIKQSQGGNDVTVLFDGNKNEMYFYLNQNEYMVLGEQEIKMIKEQMKGISAMMEQMRENLTEEQKKMLDKNLPQEGKKSTITYKMSGTANINGWNSNKYMAFEDNEKIVELFIASFSNLDFKKSDFTAMSKMMKFFQENLADLGNQFNMGKDAGFLGLSGDNPAFDQGIPVKITVFEGGEAIMDTVVDKIEKQNIDPNMFKIPANMKKKDLSQMFQSGFGN